MSGAINTARLAQWVAYALLLALATGPCLAAGGTCQPQGLLRLDTPHPSPKRVSLSFCSQYKCSCCNSSHAFTLAATQAARFDDSDVSPPCRAVLLDMACRVCDPQVGTGVVRLTCPSVCQRLYNACKQDYFAFSNADGALIPCPSGGSSALVCTTLEGLAAGPAEACTAAGLQMATKEDDVASSTGTAACWDGSPVAADACPAKPRPAAAKSKQQQLDPEAGGLRLAAWVGSREQQRLVGLLLMGLVLGAAGMAAAGWRHQASRTVSPGVYAGADTVKQTQAVAQRQMLAQAAARRLADAVADADGARDTAARPEEEAKTLKQRPKKA